VIFFVFGFTTLDWKQPYTVHFFLYITLYYYLIAFEALLVVFIRFCDKHKRLMLFLQMRADISVDSKQSHMTGVQFPLTDEALEKLVELKEKKLGLVQLVSQT